MMCDMMPFNQDQRGIQHGIKRQVPLAPPEPGSCVVGAHHDGEPERRRVHARLSHEPCSRTVNSISCWSTNSLARVIVSVMHVARVPTVMMSPWVIAPKTIVRRMAQFRNQTRQFEAICRNRT
jgi:hypothetical protein